MMKTNYKKLLCNFLLVAPLTGALTWIAQSEGDTGVAILTFALGLTVWAFLSLGPK